MSAPGLTSPIRPQGFENLQLNAGVFLKNFPASHFMSASTLRAAVNAAITAGTNILGMTTGGGTFTVARETRMPEVDGRRYPYKGAQFVDSMDAQITGTLVEITYDNFIAALGSAAIDTDNSTDYVKIVKIHTALDTETDYLNNIVWVGDLADGQYAAIEIDNALNTADISFTFQDKNEGKLPFEFHAHQSAVNVYDTAPVAVHFYAGEDDASVYADTKSITPTSGATLTVSNSVPAGVYEAAFYSADAYNKLANGTSTTLTLTMKHGTTTIGTWNVSTADHAGNGMFKKKIYISDSLTLVQFACTGTYSGQPAAFSLQDFQMYSAEVPQTPSNSVTPETGITLTGFGGTLAATTAPALYQGACTLTKSGSEPDQMALKVSAPAWDSFAVHKSGSNSTWISVPYDQKKGVVFSWGGTATQTEDYRVTVTRGTGEDVEMKFFLITVTFTYSTSV